MCCEEDVGPNVSLRGGLVAMTKCGGRFRLLKTSLQGRLCIV